MDVDKNKLQSKIFADESFLKINIIIVLFVSAFFIIHEFVEETGLRDSYIYFEIFELMGFICVVSFIYKWYSTLKVCAHKKPVQDILLDACISRKAGVGYDPIRRINRINKPVVLLALSLTGLILTVPISILFFTLVIVTLFAPPILAFVSILIGASSISKELSPGQV